MPSPRQRKAVRQAQASLFALLLVVLAVLAVIIGASTARPLNADAAAAITQPPPAVEPVALMALPPDEAREQNALQPFVNGGFPAAAPFRITGDAAAIARATDCLAIALLYEAGDNAEWQRPVAQVIINRARHPAFPKSICAVVFQGSERATGCQFSFTCDGSLARRYSDAAWQRARGIAIDALNGAVDASVGLATHYHTDWVRPYWSPHLDKLAQVGPHLFFRWPGVWGTSRAFVRGISGAEPAIAKIAALSEAHRAGLSAEELAQLPSLNAKPVSAEDVTAAVSAVIPQKSRQLGDTIILTLDRGTPPDSFPALAQAACGARTYCKVMGWSNPVLAPDAEAMGEMARASMSFSYLRDQPHNLERVLWNCDEYRREQPSQCMRR